MADATDLLSSIRDQIPDPVTNVQTTDGTFTRATLLRWLNDAGRMVCTKAPVIVDWGGVASATDMDIYELDNFWVGIDQVWYDMWPLLRAPELDHLFVTRVSGRSWWFGPHSIHATPRLNIWPHADRNGATTTLTASMTSTQLTIPVNSIASFESLGFLKIDSEIILYRSLPSTAPGNITNVLRGQAGTVAASHSSGATVSELNVMFKGNRLPRPLTAVTDPLEIPQGLWPLLEMYVLSRVREAEQDHGVARQMLQDFGQLVDDLANKLHNKAGLKQGLQVRVLDREFRGISGETILNPSGAFGSGKYGN